MVNRHMAKQYTQVPLIISLIGLSLALHGCVAALGLTLLGVGAGVTTGTSVAYTLDGIAYKTFTAPLPQVENATRTGLDSLRRAADSSRFHAPARNASMTARRTPGIIVPPSLPAGCGGLIPA